MPDGNINYDTLFQLLSGVGAGLNQDPWVQNLNALTQSGFAGKKQANILEIFAKMLSGEVPDGGKMSMDKDGMKLSVPKTALGQGGFGGLGIGNPKSYTPQSDMTTIQPYGPGPAGNQSSNVPGTQPNSFLSALLNPSSGQLSVSASDFVGLSTADVSNALKGALGIEELKQKKQTDVIDSIYKLAHAKKLIEPDALDSPYPVPHYSAGVLTNRQWSALPETDRKYSLYSYATIRKGEVPIPKAEWDLMEPTEQTKSLYQLSKDSELKDLKIELNQSARDQINIGADTLVREKTKQQAYVTGPEVISKITTDLQKDSRSWRATEQADKIAKARNITLNEARVLIQKAKIRSELDKQIRAAYVGKGKITYEKGKGWFLNGELLREDI